MKKVDFYNLGKKDVNDIYIVVERRRKEVEKQEHKTMLFDKIGEHDYMYKWANWEKYDPEIEGEEIEVGGKLVTLKKDEVLTEERITEILSDVPYPDWNDSDVPPHMIPSFMFLLKRYGKAENGEDDLQKEISDIKAERQKIEEKLKENK